jgi:hypothetical protein
MRQYCIDNDYGPFLKGCSQLGYLMGLHLCPPIDLEAMRAYFVTSAANCAVED